MKNLKIFLVLTLFFIPFAVASFAYDNPSLPKLTPPEIRTQAVNNNSINVNNSNCWQNDCSGFRNPFNQWLNTTNNATFNNLTVNGGSYFSKLGTFDVDLSDPALKWVRFTGFGGSAEAANLNFALGAFLFQATNNFALYFGNDDLSALISLLDTGYIEFATSNGVYMRDASSRWFETNATRTHIYGNSSFTGVNNSFTNNVFIGQNTTIKGLRHDWAVANGIINATGVNITSNHQIYNVSTSLDTTYTNQNQRPIHLISSIQISASPSDIGAVQAYVNGNLTQIIGLDLSSASFESIGTILELSTYVPPNGVYSLNTTISGSAFILMKGSRITVI